MSDVIVYEKRTCTTCRKVADLLRSRGIEYDDVQYHVEGISAQRIRELLAMAGISAAEALRMREDGAAELGGCARGRDRRGDGAAPRAAAAPHRRPRRPRRARAPAGEGARALRGLRLARRDPQLVGDDLERELDVAADQAGLDAVVDAFAGHQAL